MASLGRSHLGQVRKNDLLETRKDVGGVDVAIAFDGGGDNITPPPSRSSRLLIAEENFF